MYSYEKKGLTTSSRFQKYSLWDVLCTIFVLMAQMWQKKVQNCQIGQNFHFWSHLGHLHQYVTQNIPQTTGCLRKNVRKISPYHSSLQGNYIRYRVLPWLILKLSYCLKLLEASIYVSTTSCIYIVQKQHNIEQYNCLIFS